MKYLITIVVLLLMGCSSTKPVKVSYLINCHRAVPDNYVTSAWLEEEQVGELEAVDPSCILGLTE